MMEDLLFGMIVTQHIPQKRMQRILLGAVLIHVFWIQGWQQRKGTRPIAKEPVYSNIPSGEGAILELYPVFSSYSNVDPLDIKNQLCLQQLVHHRPLLISCMGTRTDDSVDWIIRTQFLEEVLDTPSHNWNELLAHIGVDTVVLHRDWFSTDDVNQIDIILSQWFGKPTATSNSGHIQIWTLSIPPASREEAKLAVQSYFPELQ